MALSSKGQPSKDQPSKGQWFLLRGLARQSAHWGEFIDTMKIAFPGWEILTLDLPGVGTNSAEIVPFTINDNAQFVRREFKRLHKPGLSAYIFSVSLGAMVATEWLRQNADDISGLVLVNASFSGVSPFYRRLRPQAFRHIFGAATEKDLIRRELQVLKMISNRNENYDVRSREWAEIQNENPIDHATFLKQLLAASRYSLPNEFKDEAPLVPVLILSSLGDRMVHPSCSTELAKLWKSDHEQHPDAGHDLPLDAGEWVAGRLRDWVAAHQKSKTK